MPYKFWLTTELKFLRDNIKTTPPSQIAKHLNRTEGSIIQKAYEVGTQPTQPHRPWSQEDIQLAQTLPIQEAVAKTGRTHHAVRMKLARLRA